MLVFSPASKRPEIARHSRGDWLPSLLSRASSSVAPSVPRVATSGGFRVRCAVSGFRV